MQTIGIAKKVVAYKTEEVNVEAFRLINPSITKEINGLSCNGCSQPIGDERPIAIVWDGKKSYRMCNKCSCHLTPR